MRKSLTAASRGKDATMDATKTDETGRKAACRFLESMCDYRVLVHDFDGWIVALAPDGSVRFVWTKARIGGSEYPPTGSRSVLRRRFERAHVAFFQDGAWRDACKEVKADAPVVCDFCAVVLLGEEQGVVRGLVKIRGNAISKE